jgi:hypothetical protein
MHAVLQRLWRPCRGRLAGRWADPLTPVSARVVWRCEGPEPREVRGYVLDAFAPSVADLATVLNDYPEVLSP